MFRRLYPYQLWTDIGVAVVFGLLTLILDPVFSANWGIASRPAPVQSELLFPVVFAGILAIRRLSPALALLLAWLASCAQMFVGSSPLICNLVIFAVLYATAAYGSRFVYWAGLVSAVVGAVVIAVYMLAPQLSFLAIDDPYFLSTAFFLFLAGAFALTLSWTAGALARLALRAREGRLAQERAELAASEEQERVRIARDMHDVVAHSLAVVIAQADGARYAAGDGVATEEALQTISRTARSALSDVRVLLTQLRHSQTDGPQPTLADLETLYAQVRSSGVTLRVDVDPAPHGTPPAATQLAVYRIVQEALTNALRHGDGTGVEVTQAWRADAVDLTVRNRVPEAVHRDPTPTPARGHGLVGMRERAALVGGTLSAQVEEGAFVVQATIPVGEAA